MKRFLITVIILLFSCSALYAIHIKGGWMYYQYLGNGTVNPTYNKYKIFVKVYRDCSIPNPGQNDDPIPITIFSGFSDTIYNTISAPLQPIINLNKTTFDACLSQPYPTVCYNILYYETTVELPPNPNGYTLSYQRCCRIGGVVNLLNPSSDYGNTYSNHIPGVINNISYSNNSSPLFAQKDTVVICHSTYFILNFSATDSDGDSLVYRFSDALNGGSTTAPVVNPSQPPSTFTSINYASPYNYLDPFGTGALIDSSTGIITGVAPATTGEYVVSVSVDEYRNGVYFATTRKELHVRVVNCSLSGAQLKPTYLTCDGFTLTFQNQSSATNITSYLWDFGVTTITTDTSTFPAPTYTYSDTGMYILKLKVSAAGGCQDSATAIVKVYPGFKPNFIFKGDCYKNPYNFYDATYNIYGYVNSWRWDFGDLNNLNDTSLIQNPSYLYPSFGTRRVLLYVSNSKGCADTISKLITLLDRPTIFLPFHDTLICSIDSLKLSASSNSSNYSWTPLYNIINASSSNPTVFPSQTQVYTVTVRNNQCINTDSIQVNVLTSITALALPDTTICQTDTIQLNGYTMGLSYHWTPSNGFISSVDSKRPFVAPLQTTKYYFFANLGKCTALDSIQIKVAPYPVVHVGLDTFICYGNSVQLNGNILADQINWTPSSSLNNGTIATPIASPDTTTSYVVTASYLTGCLKPKSDTVIVKVNPFISVKAQADTTICSSDIIRFHAVGNDTNIIYQWAGLGFLADSTTATPLVLPPISGKYKVIASINKCSVADSFYIVVNISPTAKVGEDTFICFGDSVQLSGSYTGDSFNWSPKSSLSNSNTLHPTAHPDTTTAYILSASYNKGCLIPRYDTVIIKVNPYISIRAQADTSICKTDTIRLRSVGNDSNIVYSWKGYGIIADSNTSKPLVYTLINGQYVVTASLNKCSVSDSLKVKVFPYPKVDAGLDTFICYGNQVQLNANYIGDYFYWTPKNSLINSTTLYPIAHPDSTTIYVLTSLYSTGCLKPKTDTIIVKVNPFIEVKAQNDTTICRSDTVRLRATGNNVALKYNWIGPSLIADTNTAHPLVLPFFNLIYYVSAALNGCTVQDSVKVYVYPYPKSIAKGDTTICSGSSVQLFGQYTGDSFYWTPTNSLTNYQTLSPLATPDHSTQYILTAKYKNGCLKSQSDTVYIQVIPLLVVSIGNDTTLVINQPLPLNATVNYLFQNMTYTWIPATGLDRTDSNHVIATFNSLTDSITYTARVTTKEGCFGESSIRIIVFKTDPNIFVANAFTPNGDGLNDVFKPYVVGLKNLDYFHVFNRWGQLIFSTNQLNKGWDGNYNGSAQPSGTYVFVTQGTDYLGKIINRKGTFVLIR